MNIILYITSPAQVLPFLSSFISFNKLKKESKINLFIFTRNIYFSEDLKSLIRSYIKYFFKFLKLRIIFLPITIIHLFCALNRFSNNSFLFIPTFHLGPILTILISQARCICFGEGFGYLINQSPNWAKPLPFQWRFIFKNKSIKNIASFNSDFSNSITFNKEYIADYFEVIMLMKRSIKNIFSSSNLFSNEISSINNIFVMSSLAEKNGRINLEGEFNLYVRFILANSDHNSFIGIYSHPRHDKKFIKSIIDFLNSKNRSCFDFRYFFNQKSLSNYPIELILISFKEMFKKDKLSIKVFQQSSIFLSILGVYKNLHIGFGDTIIKSFFNKNFVSNRIKYEYNLKKVCYELNQNLEIFNN